MAELVNDPFTNQTGMVITAHNSNWVATTTAETAIIHTNAVSPIGTFGGFFRNDITFPNDQYAQGKLVAIPAGVPECTGVAVRCNSSNNLYVYTGKSYWIGIVKVVSGTTTILGFVDAALSVDSVIRLEVSGTTLTPYIDGSVHAAIGAKTDTSLSSGKAGIYLQGTNVNARIDDWSAGDLVAVSNSALVPDAIAASTNLSGSVADIDDDPDSPDANWLTATSATSATDARVSFSTPSGTPNGTQNFRAQLRRTSGSSIPSVDVHLYQGGTLRRTLIDDQFIKSTSGEVLEGDWDASDLVTVTDGSDVECRIVSTAGLAAGALPAYSSDGTALSTTTVPATNDVNIPAHTSGDLLLLTVLMSDGGNNGTLASINTAGWTQAGGAGNTYGGAQRARIGFGWKIGDGSESVVNITTTGAGSTDRLIARVYQFTAANGFASPPIQNISKPITKSASPAYMPTVVASGFNQLAVAIIGTGGAGSMASATGESGGDWAVSPAGANSATNGCMVTQLADLANGDTISGGTATNPGSGTVVIGFSIVPSTGAAVNTVEIGAIEWNAQHIPGSGGGTTLPPISMHHYRMRQAA